MKKTVIALLLCTALCATVFAQTEKDFEITQNAKGTITITRYTGKATKVIIPATIKGIKVTEIGEGAFIKVVKNRDNPLELLAGNIVSVTIPDSVTSIGKSAFAHRDSLTSITIPNNITSIEDTTFLGCASLTSVTLPTSVTSIGMSAFQGCTKLTNVTIPDSITSIGATAFGGCISLTSITIPDSVTSIGAMAFYGCTKLASITIGANKNFTVNDFPNNFGTYYESQGKKAGTYTFSGGLWSVK